MPIPPWADRQHTLRSRREELETKERVSELGACHRSEDDEPKRQVHNSTAGAGSIWEQCTDCGELCITLPATQAISAFTLAQLKLDLLTKEAV